MSGFRRSLGDILMYGTGSLISSLSRKTITNNITIQTTVGLEHLLQYHYLRPIHTLSIGTHYS